MPTVRIRPGEGLVGQVAEQRIGQLVNDYRGCPQADPLLLERSAVTALLAEPLVYRDTPGGILTLFHESAGRTFSEADRNIINLLGSQTAVAVENARLYQTARQRAERLLMLNTLARTLSTATHPERVVQDIMAAVQVLLPDAVPRLWFRTHADEKRFQLVGSAGLRDPEAARSLAVEPDSGVVGIALRTRQPVASPDIRTDSRFVHRAWAESEGLVSSIVLPLVYGDTVHGALAVSTRTLHAFSTEEVELFWSFAAQASIAIENARLFSEVSQSFQDLQQAQGALIRSENLRALGQMAAGIAHDLNNMLAAILGQVDLLRLRVSSLEVHEALNLLETAAADGASIVRRLQDFSRQQASTALKPLDLERVVTEAIDLTRPRWKDEAQRRGRDIEVRSQLADLPHVLGHAPDIREALTNLIFNAVDALPQGGIIAFTGARTPEGVALTVADTGIGMPEEVRQHIFEPFFTTKGLRGTGLGLSVVYGIMERHGGRIEVASTPGRGATFTLTFQTARAGAAAPLGRAQTAIPKCRILIIDDDAKVRRTLVDLLRAIDQVVFEADNGASGLAILAETPVELVLTDLGMPEMNGWEVAGAIKATLPHLPIVLLTGWGDQLAAEEEQSQVVKRILSKPARLDDLIRVIQETKTGFRSQPVTPDVPESHLPAATPAGDPSLDTEGRAEEAGR